MKRKIKDFKSACTHEILKKNSQILTVHIGFFLSLHSRKLNWLKIKETRKPLWEKEDYDTIYICTFNDISVYSID